MALPFVHRLVQFFSFTCSLQHHLCSLQANAARYQRLSKVSHTQKTSSMYSFVHDCEPLHIYYCDNVLPQYFVQPLGSTTENLVACSEDSLLQPRVFHAPDEVH